MKPSWIACFLLLSLFLSLAQGRSRKLANLAAPAAPTSNPQSEQMNSNGGNGGNNSTFKGKGVNGGKLGRGEEKKENFRINSSSAADEQILAHEPYPDILDIAGMDYSQAKRKPPIHN